MADELVVLPHLPRWSAPAVAVATDRHEAIARLPGSPDDDAFYRLAMAFLAGYPANSARAYRVDLRAWASCCEAAAVHPFEARRHHVDAWVRVLETEPLARTGRTMSPASIARRLSALAKFYRYGIEVEVLTYSPVDNVRRPRVSDASSTVGLSALHLLRLLDVADAHSPRSSALLTLLAYNGLRIDEALATNVTDYTYDAGHRVLRIVRKGRKAATEPLAPRTVRALDAYIAERSSGPVFLDRTGTARLSYKTAFDMIRRLARKADVAGAASITPHSFRHTYVTQLLNAKVLLQDVQDAVGHADPRTTRRYDHNRVSLDAHPTYVLGPHLEREASKAGDIAGGER
jgi:integrase/recombinase XerD